MGSRPTNPTRSGFFVRKPLEEAVRETERSGYRRALGAFDLVSLGVAAVIGAGIFVGIGQASRDAGPAVVVSFVVAGLACIFAALAYAELASIIPGSGSAYTFAYASLGQAPAFLMAWFLVLEYLVGNMFVATGWSGYVVAALDDLGVALPLALRASFLESPGGGFNLPAALIALLVAFLVVLGIRESVRVGHALVAFKLLVVVFVVAAGLFLIHPENLSPFSPHGISGINAATAAVFFSYIGFDVVSATAEEAKNPRRDLPIGIVGSLVVSMTLYVLVALVLNGMVSSEALDPDAPLARAFQTEGLGWAAPLVTLGAVVATTTVLLAFSIGLPRIFQAVARDGLLPARFARLHPRFRTPVALTIVAGIVTALGAGLLPEEVALDLTSLGTLAIYLLVCVGVLVLKRVEPGVERPFRTHWVFPALGILFCTVIAIGIEALVQFVFLGWVGAGLMLYGFYGHRRARALRQAPGR